MTSFPNPTASPPASENAALAASGGVPYAWKGEASPLDAWIDLMEAVEALCPRWPERPIAVGRDYRL